MENKQVYAKTIKPRKTGEAPTTVVLDKKRDNPDRTRAKSLAEEIAGNPVFTRNWYYPQGWSFFPNEPDMRCVDYHFPYAEGGALLIDVITDIDGEERLKSLERKGKVLRDIGHRYLILKPRMSADLARAELSLTEVKK